MRLWLTIAAVVLILELAFYLALPWLLSLRGIEVLRRGLRGMTLVFETPDEDGTPVRLLNVDGTFQSASYTSDELWSELVCVYHRTMVDQIDELGTARDVLVIGGGGYSLPKFLVTHTRRMRVCVVEIDPQMTQIARQHFFLDRAQQLADGRLECVCADGWQWLQDSGRHFDVIVNDAFLGSRPVAGLSTRQAAELIYNRLSDRGLYLANIRCSLQGRGARTLREIEEAYASVFDSCEVIPETLEAPRQRANNVLVARKGLR